MPVDRRTKRPGKRGRKADRPAPDQRQALELLASCPDGCPEGLLLTNGFCTQAVLASATAERVVIHGHTTTEVARLRITEAGRRCWRRSHETARGSIRDDPEHWRERAEEARHVAGQMSTRWRGRRCFA
jgi:hypothetical protein